jgi:hypothetical protein
MQQHMVWADVMIEKLIGGARASMAAHVRILYQGPSDSELRLQIQVRPILLARIHASRDVESEQAVEE